MGEVWLARTHGPGGFTKLVALKVSSGPGHPEAEPNAVLRHEARVAAGLSHPNLVDVYELGQDQGRDFIAMEYVPGVDLRRVFEHAQRQHDPLPAAAWVWVVVELLAGLEHAHRATDEAGRPLGLVHRDVSPTNVLLSFAGEVKLIDFGIAKVAGTSETRTGTLKGKFRYMSPEQARGERLDARSDVYAAGALLYEALTLHPAFTGEDDVVVLNRVQRGEHEPLEPLPEALRAIVGRALARDPEARFPSAEALRSALAPHAKEWSASQLAAWLTARFPAVALPPPVPERSEPIEMVVEVPNAPDGRSAWGPWLALTLLLLPVLLAAIGVVAYWLVGR